MSDHPFAEAADPRSKDCLRCGRPQSAHEATRNPGWEEEFHLRLGRDVARRTGFDVGPLVALTQHRMEVGSRVYGDSGFLTDGRDLIGELREETADTVAYVIMELQRLLAAGIDEPERIHHLWEAAVHACVADAHAIAAKRSRA